MEKRNVLKSGDSLWMKLNQRICLYLKNSMRNKEWLPRPVRIFWRLKYIRTLTDRQPASLMKSILKKEVNWGMACIPEELNGSGNPLLLKCCQWNHRSRLFISVVLWHIVVLYATIMYYVHMSKGWIFTKLATGWYLGAYATEPGAEWWQRWNTKATLVWDGNFIFEWSENVDYPMPGSPTFRLFSAKVDNDRVLSAFIVERNMRVCC